MIQLLLLALLVVILGVALGWRLDYLDRLEDDAFDEMLFYMDENSMFSRDFRADPVLEDVLKSYNFVNRFFNVKGTSVQGMYPYLLNRLDLALLERTITR